MDGQNSSQTGNNQTLPPAPALEVPQTTVAPPLPSEPSVNPVPAIALASQPVQINSQPATVEQKPFILFDPSFLIRVGLAFVFTYAAINFFLNPDSALKYIPGFVSSTLPTEIFLHFFEGYEILLAIWLLSGKFSQYAGILSALTLVGITGLNLESFSVVFRNVAIIFAAIALAVMRPVKKR